MSDTPLELQETDIVLPAERLEMSARTHEQEARSIIVRDQASLDAAGEFLNGIKALRAEAEAHHRPLISSAHETHKRAIEALRRVDEPLARAEALVKPKISGFIEEQRRIEAERKRIEDERICREEQERKRAQEEALEADIEAAEARGASADEIRAMIEQPVKETAFRPTPVPAAPRVEAPKGIQTREQWSAQVVNIRELCRAVADGKVPEALVTPNATVLNQMARALKQTMNIPGVKAIMTANVAAGRR